MAWHGGCLSTTLYMSWCCCREAGAEDVEKASLLYKWAKDAGINVSRDELLQQLQAGSLPAELAKLWEAKSASRAQADELLKAVAAGDSAAVKVGRRSRKDMDMECTIHFVPQRGVIGMVWMQPVGGRHASSNLGGSRNR